MYRGLYKWPPLDQVLLLLSRALNITAGRKLGSEREGPAQSHTAVPGLESSCPALVVTFDGQDVEGDRLGARDSCD